MSAEAAPPLPEDAASGRTSTASADAVIAWVREQGLSVEWLLETHVHADHLSAAPYLQREIGGAIGIGENIRVVQDTFGKIFNAGTEFERDGSQFDRLFKEQDRFAIGALQGFVLHTPGHTPACLTYVIGAAARIFTCHDYTAPGRDDYRWESTVGEQRAKNVHIGGSNTEADFIRMRTERDAKLGMPKLIIPSIQVNMRAGRMPPAEDNGTVYLKTPINRF